MGFSYHQLQGQHIGHGQLLANSLGSWESSPSFSKDLVGTAAWALRELRLSRGTALVGSSEAYQAALGAPWMELPVWKAGETPAGPEVRSVLKELLHPCPFSVPPLPPFSGKGHPSFFSPWNATEHSFLNPIFV